MGITDKTWPKIRYTPGDMDGDMDGDMESDDDEPEASASEGIYFCSFFSLLKALNFNFFFLIFFIS